MPSLAALLDDTWRELSPRDRVLHEIWDEVGLTGEEASANLTTPTTPPCSLVQFVQEAWPLVDPAPYVHGWHLDTMCDHFEAVIDGRIQKLLVNISPGSAKSLVVAVLLPAWVWTWWPSFKWIYTSYSGALSMRDSVKCRDLIRSLWYQRRFQPKWTLKRDQDMKARFENTAQGFRLATSVGAMATGEHADCIVGDDLHSTREDLSETRADMLAAVDFWTVVMPSRVTNPKTARSIVIGQRVGEDDISATLLKQGDYEYLCIPAEYEPPGEGIPQSRTSLNWVDPRTEPGAPMYPALYDTPQLAALKVSLGHAYYSQYQQRPTADAEALFKRDDWQYFDIWPPMDFFDLLVQSWDLSVKDEADSSYVAGHLWGQKGVQVVLLDRIWARMDFPASLVALRGWRRKWPQTHATMIEDKANGSPLYQMVRSEIPRVIPINPQGQGSKLVRLRAVAPVQRAHNAFLPSPALAPWVHEFVENMARLQEDDGDALSQAWSQIAMPSPALDEARQAALKARELHLKIQQAAHRNGHGEHSRSHV